MNKKVNISLYELLRKQTSRIPVTNMNEYKKYLVFSAVLLGMPEIKGAFRPRDLPFDKDAVSILEFSHILAHYCFDASLPVYLWNENIKHTKDIKPSNNIKWRRISDFIIDTGLVLSTINITEKDKLDAETVRKINMTITLFLLLIEGALLSTTQSINKRKHISNDIDKCFIELELDKKDYNDKILFNTDEKVIKKKYSKILQFFRDIARREIQDYRFSIYSLKLLDINRKFLKRWEEAPTMQRGASGLVYFAIAIIREKIIRELGPSAVIHDYAGTIYFIAPYDYKISNSVIQKELINSFKPGGWIHSQFSSALRYEDKNKTEYIDTFPEVSLKRLAKEQSLSQLATWKQKIYTKKKKDDKIEINKNHSCEQCGQYDAVDSPRRWKSKKNNKLCNICLLIADGVSPMLRFRFMSDVINYFDDYFYDLSASFHLNAKNNTMNESGQTAFFCTDGNGVGQIVSSAIGIYELKNIAMNINFDLRNRIRYALENIYKSQKTNNSVAVELLWLGGDDLLIRCKPEMLKYFEEAFSYTQGDLFSYAIGTSICDTSDNDGLNKGRITAQENMKECKIKMKETAST